MLTPLLPPPLSTLHTFSHLPQFNLSHQIPLHVHSLSPPASPTYLSSLSDSHPHLTSICTLITLLTPHLPVLSMHIHLHLHLPISTLIHLPLHTYLFLCTTFSPSCCITQVSLLSLTPPHVTPFSLISFSTLPPTFHPF